MSVLDRALELSDAQSVALSSTATVYSTDVIDMRTGQTDGWGTAISPDMGNMVLNVEVSTALVGAGGTLTPALLTKAADASLSSGATTLVTLETIAATAAIGTVRQYKFPVGFTCLRYLGLGYTGGATISAGNVNAWISLDNEVTD